MTSCFVYKVIRYLESIDHLCINPVRDLSICVSSSGVYKLMFYLTIIYYCKLTNTSLSLLAGSTAVESGVEEHTINKE